MLRCLDGDKTFMMKRRLELAEYVGKYSCRLGPRRNKRFYTMKRRMKTCRTCGKICMETGNSNNHIIQHDEEEAQKLQDMWQIIHGEWDIKKRDFTSW